MRATPEVVTEKGDMETAARTQVSVQAVAVDSGESNEDGVAQILSSQNPPENTEGPEDEPPLTPIDYPRSQSGHNVNENADGNAQLPPLDFKPLMLRTEVLFAGLTFNTIILGILVGLNFVTTASFESQWGYFTIQILPPICGTITASLWRGVTLNLSRVTPFMLCAQQRPSFAQRTILMGYSPAPAGPIDCLLSRNVSLSISGALLILSGTILGLKSALLNTVSWQTYWQANVTLWALYPLIAIYAAMNLLTLLLIWDMWGKCTGLRWDPICIADHLALLKYANFLDDFEGTDLSTRDSMIKELGGQRYRLGYWNRGSKGTWYGFGRVENSSGTPAQQSGPPNNANQAREGAQQEKVHTDKPQHNEPITMTMSALSHIRYRSVTLNLRRWVMFCWTFLAVALLGLAIAALMTGWTDGQHVALSFGVASFLFQFLITLVVSGFTWFWEDLDLFCRSTQPFVGMYKPNPAAENLLLDYTTLLPVIVTLTAMTNRHWKVARASVLALVTRLLPIIVGGSITIVAERHDDNGVEVHASKPLFLWAMVFFASFILLIPFEVTRDGYYRHLPRNMRSIADVVSWCYASRLLRRCDVFDVAINGPESELWHMHARLRLLKKEYQFGLYKNTVRPSTYCIGFDEAENVIEVPEPPEPWTGRLWARRRKQKAEIDRPRPYTMSDTSRFEPLLESKAEQSTSVFNYQPPGQHGQEQPEEEV